MYVLNLIPSLLLIPPVHICIYAFRSVIGTYVGKKGATYDVVQPR